MSSLSNVNWYDDVVSHTCDYDLTINHAEFQDKSFVKSPQFCAETNTSIRWSFEIRLLHNEVLHDFADASLILKVIPTNTRTNETNQNPLFGGEVAFHLGSNTQQIICQGTFVFEENKECPLGTSHREKSVYLSSLGDQGHRLLSFEEDLKLRCEITFYKLNDVLTRFIFHVHADLVSCEEVRYSLQDSEKLYLNEVHSDVTICIKVNSTESKEYPAHKKILSARSKVFEAMFKLDTVENESRIVVDDIEEEVFLETLRYIYTGQIQNLDALVYELYPVADRYGLEMLKIICRKALYEKLSVETVLEIVKLADTYDIGDLKITAIKFIKNIPDFFKSMDSKVWNDLLSKPQLVKDLLIASNSVDDKSLSNVSIWKCD